jgi:hypothetical protein
MFIVAMLGIGLAATFFKLGASTAILGVLSTALSCLAIVTVILFALVARYRFKAKKNSST